MKKTRVRIKKKDLQESKYMRTYCKRNVNYGTRPLPLGMRNAKNGIKDDDSIQIGIQQYGSYVVDKSKIMQKHLFR